MTTISATYHTEKMSRTAKNYLHDFLFDKHHARCTSQDAMQQNDLQIKCNSISFNMQQLDCHAILTGLYFPRGSVVGCGVVVVGIAGGSGVAGSISCANIAAQPSTAESTKYRNIFAIFFATAELFIDQ